MNDEIDIPFEMHERFAAMAVTLRELVAGKTVYYHPNHGNWGDGLIMAGTLPFLRDAGIEFSECHYQKIRKPRVLRAPEWLRSVDRENSVLIYGGGGGWCRLWDIEPYVRHLTRYFSHTVVLPSTFEYKPRLHRATIFCRDRFQSQEITGGEFCDDMAFYLGRRPSGLTTQGEGNFFRTDKESGGFLDIPEGNRDLSLEHDYKYPVRDFFAALEPYQSIRTDRLHVSIAASLLGKNVSLYPGGYFKSEALFRSSMQGTFPGTKFMNSDPAV